MRAAFVAFVRKHAVLVSVYEYEYADQYMKLSPLGLLWLDLKIIGRGIKVIAKGKGL
jgi:hypothetical protein